MRNTTRHGFTLIEMLVVIAIIAILASLILAAAGGAITSAARNKANAECSAGALAVANYFADFKKYPLPDSLQGGAKGTHFDSQGNAAALEDLIETLTGDNPREKVYLSVKRTADTDEGEFIDPWDTPYRFVIDTDFDGKISENSGGTANAITGYDPIIFLTRCIVISAGKDETFGTKDDLASEGLTQ